MFDGEIVKKNVPFKKILDLENFWFKTRSKTKLDLENFHKIFFVAKSLKMSCLWRNCEKNVPFKIILDLENFQSKTESKTRPKTKLDLENFHKIFCCKKP